MKKGVAKSKSAYKEPVFLFTSSSMRLAAWAGWYSAFGDKEQAEKYIHMAHSEWARELGAGRRYAFLDRFNNDISEFVPQERLKELVDNFLKTIKAEIKKRKPKVRE